MYSGQHTPQKGELILHRFNSSLRYESGVEKAVLRLLGTCPHVREISRAETVKVYLSNGQITDYTADFCVSLRDGRVVTVEAKPSNLLAQLVHSAVSVWHARAAVLAELGRPLYFATELDAPDIQIEHAKHFGPYHGVSIHPDLRTYVFAMLRERGAMPLTELRRVLFQLLPTLQDSIDGGLCALVARHELVADASVNVPDCRLALPGGTIVPPSAPIGRPLAQVVLEERPESEGARSSGPKVSPRERQFLSTPRGERYQKLFGLYNDPSIPLTEAHVALLIAETAVSRRGIFRFRRLLMEAGAPGIIFGDVLPELIRSWGRPRRQVDIGVQILMEQLTRDHYLQPLGHAGRARTLTDLHLLLRQACLRSDLPPPAYNTVKAFVRRYERRDPIAAAKLRHGREAAQALEPRQGQYAVRAYGDLIGVDCTPCDVFTREHGTIIQITKSGRGKAQRSADAQRANLVTVVDVMTSQVLRSVVVAGPIGAATILGVLRDLFLGDVTAMLAAGVTIPPQAAGLPRAIRIDGGTEFVNRAVKASLLYLGIEVVNRNKWSRHHGGVEERVIGTLTRLHQVLPGTTSNNIANRGEYDAQRGAVLTIADLDRYHQRSVEQLNAQCVDSQMLTRQEHARQLKDTGRSRWRPLTEAQEQYVRTRLLPAEMRMCARDGIHLHGLSYVSPALELLLSEKVEVYYDPEDISVAQAVHPTTGEMIELRARLPEGLRPPVSLAQMTDLKKRIRAAQQAARDQIKTPQQLALEIMAEREVQKASRQKKNTSIRAVPIKSAVGAESGASRIRPANITFEDFAPEDSHGH